jgi:hypothetical protein
LALKSTVRAEGATIVANEDGSPLSLVVIPPATVHNGSTGTMSVKLPCQPGSNVTVRTSVVDGSNQLSVSAGASLTFTNANWNTPQNVTLQSVSGQGGWQRVLISASGVDFPGFASVTVHILVS